MDPSIKARLYEELLQYAQGKGAEGLKTKYGRKVDVAESVPGVDTRDAERPAIEAVGDVGEEDDSVKLPAPEDLKDASAKVSGPGAEMVPDKDTAENMLEDGKFMVDGIDDETLAQLLAQLSK